MNFAVGAAGSTIEFDCATAEISKQLRKKRNGSFEAVGTLTRSGPGPIRIDRQPEPIPVKFSGKVSGKTMKVAVTNSATGEDLGTYTLTLGVAGRIRRCL